MSRQIRTTFFSPEEAVRAKEYLASNGFSDVSVDGPQLEFQANEENWIAAFEIVNSLGGAMETNEEFRMQLDAAYQIEADEDDHPDQEMSLVDPNAYIDANLGYGDYEIIEPYILHDYLELTEKDE